MMRLHDPEGLTLRRAARTTLVLPPLLAMSLTLVRDSQFATFIAFGVFAMLVFADFGGPLGPRVRAYVALTAVGGVCIAAATLLSRETWAAVAGMAGAAFLITFLGALGGYVTAGGFAAVLSFVLAVAVPADAAQLPARLAGWALAGAISAIAAVALWPARPRAALRRRAAEAASRLADLVDAGVRGEEDPARIPDLRTLAADATARLERQHTEMVYRPAGPATHAESLAYLVSELRSSLQFADRVAAARMSSGLAPAEDRRLAGAIAVTLREMAAGLTDPSRVIDLSSLEGARRENHQALAASLLRMLRRADPARAMAERVRRAFSIRVLSFAVLSAAANAILTSGKRPALRDFDVAPLVPPPNERMHRLRTLLESHLRVDSVRCQAAVRAAAALAIGILLARVGRLEHGFWVVLATASVLKSSSTSTHHTAWQALGGAVAGFGIVSPFMLAVGPNHTALWIALPIFVFLAVYTPTAVHFIVGQTTFTLMVVVLFTLIQPEGWRMSVARVEDVLVGLGTAVIIGAMFWPRGAHGQLRASLASLFETGGVYLITAMRHLLGRVSPRDLCAAGADAAASSRRASETFAAFLNEAGPKRPPVSTWSRLLVAGNQFRVAADALMALAGSDTPSAAIPGVVPVMNNATEHLQQTIQEAARRLVRRADSGKLRDGAPPSPETTPSLLHVVLRTILECRTETSDLALQRTLHLAWTAEWIAHTHETLNGLAEPLAQVQAAAATPWWR